MTAAQQDSTICLTLPADYEELPLIRHVIRQTLAPLSRDQESRYLGAVTEIAVNAIESVTATARQRSITLTIQLHPQPTVTIADHGLGIDASELQPAKCGNLGQGLIIAKAAVPNLSISSTDEGTIVRLPYPLPNQAAS